MFHIVLFQPEIPPNTGNAIRLSANAGAHLHLVKPLGFSLSDKHLARAGLDYHDLAHVTVHEDWAACRACLGERRIFTLSTRGTRSYVSVEFQPGDAFLFGSETSGLPNALHAEIGPERSLRIPMMPGNRSMNLSNAVAVVVMEAWRQQGFRGGV
jgi:tRNA (cytidine/uridine-2'-O-)-methyltransferase